MKKFLTVLLVLAIAGSMGTTAVFAAPDEKTVEPGKTLIEKVLLKVNCYGSGQIAGTDDGSEPVFNEDAPMQSIAFDMDKGATAKITAKADEGYKFMYWYDVDNDTFYSLEDTIEVEVNEALNLIAYFDVDAERVLLRGGVEGEGIIEGTMDGSEPEIDDDFPTQSVALNVIKGETAKLKAKPKEGYIFLCWIDKDTKDIVSFEDTVEVTMDEPKYLVAVFDVDGERHRVNVNIGDGVGSLAWSEDGSEPEFDEYNTTSLSLSILEGRSVKLKAKADEGYKFMFWYDEDKDEVIGLEDTLSVEVTEGMNITANFDLDVDRITLEIATEGMGQVIGDENGDDPQFDDDASYQSLYLRVIPGNTVVIKAKADEGYKFVGWKNAADGKIVSTDAVYGVEVNEAMKLVAVFEPIENDDDGNDKTDNSGSSTPSNTTTTNGGSTTSSSTTPANAPATGDAASAAATAAVALASLGAAVMFSKKRRRDAQD